MSFCQACHLTFDDFEAQRAHYKTELHRFNLKRKVAGLPHVPQDVFESRVASVRAEEQSKKDDKSPSAHFCQICRKKFLSISTYNAHVASKKHKEAERAASNKLVGRPESEGTAVDRKVPLPFQRSL